MEKEMTIEQAQSQLEEVIKKFETETLPLQESVELYAKGCELLALCMDKLDSYKGKIEEIDKALASQRAEEFNGNGQ